MAAVCKPVARAILSLMGAQRTGWNALHVGRVAQRPVRFYGRYHDGSRTVIGGEHPLARRIDTQVGGTPTLRIDYVQELQAAVRLNSDAVTEPFFVPLKFGSSQRIAGQNHTCRGTSCLMKSRPASRSGDSRRASLATLGPGRRDRHTTCPGCDSDSARLRRRRQSESRDRRALYARSEKLSHLRKLAQGPVLIGTWADAIGAIRFYEKHGFHVVRPKQKDSLLRR